MKILIDNGHGHDTPGKCSPDGKLKEYKWSREISSRLVAELRARGYDAELIVTEEQDVSLKERCRRVNAICNKIGSKNTLLISIHINAADADGKWHDARGWSVWVAPNASGKSRKLALLLYQEAINRNLQGNRYVPPCHYWVKPLAMVRDTLCPAVLTENLFMDNREDVAYLLSEQGKQAIVDIHVDAIKKYL